MFANQTLAKNYNWMHPYGLAPLRELLQFEDRRNNILDVGCGAGRVLKMMSEMGFDRLTGIERSPEMSASAQPTLGGSPWVIENMSIFDYTIEHDIVLCVFSLHLLGDLREALKHLTSLTKKKLIVATIDYDNLSQSTISRLFPETLTIDCNRFFPISRVDDILRDSFSCTHTMKFGYNLPVPISQFIQSLSARYISALNFVSDERIATVCNALEKLHSKDYYISEHNVYAMYERRKDDTKRQ